MEPCWITPASGRRSPFSGGCRKLAGWVEPPSVRTSLSLAFFRGVVGDRSLEDLVRDLLAAFAPTAAPLWLCIALPDGTPRVIGAPGVPAAVTAAVADLFPALAARLPRTTPPAPAAPLRLGAGPLAGLAVCGSGSSCVVPVAPARGALGGVIWFGAPPGQPAWDPCRRLPAGVDDLRGAVAVLAAQAHYRTLFRWCRRLVRTNGLIATLASGASLAQTLDALCRSFEGISPARWAVIPWVGREAGRVYAPSLAPAVRAALEGAALEGAARASPTATATATAPPPPGAPPHRALYQSLGAALGADAGAIAYAHTVRAANREIVASVVILDVAPHELRSRDRIILRAASNIVVLALERQRLRRLRVLGQARYRTLLDATSHVVWFADAEGTIRQARGWQELTGHSLPEAMAGWLAAIHPDDRRAMRLACEAVQNRDGEAAARVVECRIGASDGRYHHLRFHLTALRDRDEGPGEMLAAAWDVTSAREAERALQGLVAERERYASVLAHELRTPLATMSAALEVLRPAVAAAPLAQEALAVLNHTLADQSRLVNRLLDSARLGGGRPALALRALELTALLDGLAPSLALQARQKGVALSLNRSPEPLWLAGDRDRLLQLVNNLVTNAVRYTPAGGAVGIGLERDGEWAVLSVADDGIGIAPADLDRIFDPYYRAPRTDRADRRGADDDSGLGLGLHLVREVVRAHGGEIDAASAGPGRGSRFSVRLPVRSPLPSQRLLAAPAPTPTPAPGPGPGREVLIVEDDDGLREMLVAILAREGFTARTARTGAEALGRAETARRLCAAIMDLGLPDMSGLDLLPHVRALPGLERLPALALTGWGEAADVEASRAAGFDRHLVKPADIAAIATWLHGAAGGPANAPAG